MQLIDLQQQYKIIEKQIADRIETVHRHGQYILGPEVYELEEKLADYTRINHVVTCANGTDAIEIALKCLGIGAGDFVFCPTFTFFASGEAIVNVGATPIFVDVESSSFNMCIDSLSLAIDGALKDLQQLPKAILCVDLFGQPANMAKLKEIADHHNLFLIVDGAQSFGSSINGHSSYSYSDIGTTSFFPSKPLGCYGDGGAIFTNNSSIAALARSLREHGKGNHKYENLRIGRNSRLDTIQAAVLLEKLKLLPNEIERRNEIANKYLSKLKKTYQLPVKTHGVSSAWAQFTLQAVNRDAICQHLNLNGIPTAIYYPSCLHEQTALDKIFKIFSPLKNAESITKTCFSVPMHPYLKDHEIDIICDHLNEI